MNENKFDKKSYNKQYQKEKCISYGIQYTANDAKDIEQYRLLNNLTKSEFLRQCIEYFLENH